MTATNTPTADLLAARKALKLRIASAILAAMADTQVDVEELAFRAGVKPERIRRWLMAMINGRSVEFNTMSDLAWTMGMVWKVGLEPAGDGP